ncbi:MAG: molecular chaperone HtpG [Planctomycetaceae bacterium]
MTATNESTQYTFQAEIAQLLQLLSHSLYQNREIAIRELVSNASDALDKARFLAVSSESISSDEAFEISIAPDKDGKTLSIVDNGIGMTQDDLVQNLGTIARSGSLDFMNKLSGDEKEDLSIIGQFGVGFYSAFMLADKVEVVTRNYEEESGWRWQSDGTGSFTIEAAEVEKRGTEIRLHLKDDLAGEFTEPTRLKYIISTYSTFVPYPIKLDGEHLNDQPPIWVEPKSSLKQEQYDEFFQYLTRRPGKPLWQLHLSADSPFQFYSILFCPESNLEKLGFGHDEHGLHLCAKRILVQNDNRELLPEYLRFLHGLVDSADLPLNVSREALQDNTVFRKMRKVLVKRVLDHLAKMAKDDADAFAKFYEEFGTILREGVSSDFENKDKIAGLLRFQSSHDAESNNMVSLDAYIERTPEEQKQIYFIGGSDRSSIERSPNLEVFRKRNLEVLYLVDPADEFVLSHVGKFNDYEIVSVDSAELELPDVGDNEDEQDDDGTPEPDAAGLGLVLKLFKDALGDKVADVRKSERLTDSACCVVNPEGGMSTQMQKVLQQSAPGFEMNKLIFEVNPKASLVARLCEIVKNDDNGAFVEQCGQQLYANALVQAGLAPNGDEMADRVQRFMEELAGSKSSIAMS